MGTVLRDAAFMGLVGLTFLIAMVDGLGGTALPIEMGRNGFDAEAYGLVISLNGLLIVLAQIPLTRLTERRSRLLVLVTAALLDGVGFWLTDFAATLWFYALTVVVWTAGEMLRTPANMALVAELSPTHARGRYQGVYSLAWQGASFLAPLAAGAMLTGWGGSSVWTACLALGLLCSAGYVRLLRGHPQTPEQASGLPAEQASGQASVNADDPVGAAS
jgi:MFS family permease